MNEATYYACIRILSESVGKLPLKMQKQDKNHGIGTASDHPLYRMLRYRPNPYQSATAFWTAMEQAKHHDGNAIALIMGSGKDTFLWQLPWSNIEVWYDDKRIFGEENSIWYLYRPPDGKVYKLHNEQVIHFRNSITRDRIIGVPVREYLGSLINSSNKSQQMMEKLYENGLTAKAVVQYTGNLDDALEKKLVSKVQDYAEGKIDGSKSLIPLPVGMKLEPLNIKLTDAQHAEIQKLSALRLAAAFGIRPQQINDYEKASYASAEAQQLAFYVDKLLFELKGNEEEISNKLLSHKDISEGYFCAFNAKAILRTDTKTQMESLMKGVSNGIYTPNEAREMLDLGKREGGDQLIVNGNAIPLVMAGQQYNKEGKEA
ncbi:MAG: phage portal protein [Clostridiales bacterium]|nr:phage portal protein [Clostridiales bacterium]